MSRCALMRPAMRKLAPSANFSRTRAISPEVSKAAPKGATPSSSKAANFSRRNASNSLSVCSMPASDSKQNQPNEQIEWGSASILPEGLASKQTDIYRDKFGWKGEKDGEIFLSPGIFSLNSKNIQVVLPETIYKNIVHLVWLLCVYIYTNVEDLIDVLI